MHILFYSSCWLGLFLCVLIVILFILARKGYLSLPETLSLGDLTNLVAVLFAVFSLAFAIASFQDSAASANAQEQTLRETKKALDDSVALANEQIKNSDSQVKLLSAAKDALKSQLDLAIQRRKEEAVQAAMKPDLKLMTEIEGDGYWEGSTPVRADNPLTVNIYITNVGIAAVLDPVVELSATTSTQRYSGGQQRGPVHISLVRQNSVNEQLESMSVRDQNAFLPAKQYHGPYLYRFNVKYEPPEAANWLYVNLAVSGRNIETVEDRREVIVVRNLDADKLKQEQDLVFQNLPISGNN